jgi:antitoxin HicB
MKSALYPARIWKEDNVYYVQFLDLENAFTHGNSLPEAKEMAADVLSALLTSYIEHGEPIPKHSDTKGKDVYLIAPDAKVQAALLLRIARAGIPQSKIAQAMGTTWQAYQKIELPSSNTTLSKLQKAAKALGKRLVIELMDDANVKQSKA